MKAFKQTNRISLWLVILSTFLYTACSVYAIQQYVYTSSIDTLFSSDFTKELQASIVHLQTSMRSPYNIMNYLLLRYPAIDRVLINKQKSGQVTLQVLAKQPLCQLNHQYILTDDSFFLATLYNSIAVQQLCNLQFQDNLDVLALQKVRHFIMSADHEILLRSKVIWHTAYDIVLEFCQWPGWFIKTRYDIGCNTQFIKQCDKVIQDYLQKQSELKKINKKKKEKQYVCDMRFTGQYVVFEL
jgi:hypothetical protein